MNQLNLLSIPRWNPDWEKCSKPEAEGYSPPPLRKPRGFKDVVEQKMGQIQTIFLELKHSFNIFFKDFQLNKDI